MTIEFDTTEALQAVSENASPQWLKTWQKQGQLSFQNLSWPTRKTEDWKYTPLKSLLDTSWKKNSSQVDSAGIQFESWNEIRIDIVNGEIISAVNLPDGVSIQRLSECDQADGTEFLNRVDAERQTFIFDSLNQAALDQGYWLKVEANTVVAQPLHLNFISDGDDSLVSTQVLVDLGVNASLTLTETFTQTADSNCLVNANTALFVSENAKLTHYHLLLEEGQSHHIGRVTASLEKFSLLTGFHMAIGGVVKRKDITVRHKGEGAQLSLNGVYLPKGNEVIDYHTTIEHEVPNCESEEIFRGIIGDKAKAVFNGRIHIHKDAQKSVALLNNRNLLLSPTAEINTKPELEIYADDVRCAHGATIAQLDANQLFYFQSRGISKKEAEVMLSFGFINELLDALDDEPVQLLLRPLLSSLFAKKQSELARHIL